MIYPILSQLLAYPSRPISASDPHLPEPIQLSFQPPPLNHQPHRVGKPLWRVGDPSGQEEYLQGWVGTRCQSGCNPPTGTSVPAASEAPSDPQGPAHPTMNELSWG